MKRDPAGELAVATSTGPGSAPEGVQTYRLDINGAQVEAADGADLLVILRDQLHLKSVKDGCNQGACGTCMVLVDGKSVRACTQRVSRLVGKKIVTVEGFTERERKVFGYAFGKKGSVQCGFCVPGMVISAKGLIDTTPEPSRDEVRHALRTNICRCTGYQQIVDGVLLAAKMLHDDADVPVLSDNTHIGEEVLRVDAVEKALGSGQYVDDIEIDGMVHGRNVFTKHARALIKSIDTTAAAAMPGVIAVYTAQEIPGSRYIGHLYKDWPGMIAVGEETKCIGDTLALVVAETGEQAEAAVEAVAVEYDVRQPLNSPEEALAEDAPLVHGEGYHKFGTWTVPTNNVCAHEEIVRGDVAAGFERSTYIAEATFDLPPQEHAFMETEAAIGIPDGDGVMAITAGQGIYDEHHELSEYLGLPPEKVRVRSALVGGGFGGKEDMSVQHQAALAAYLCQRPVKVKFGRTESLNYHPKRHAMKIHMRLGCDDAGIFQAMEAKIVSDTGAYASLGGPVLQRACTHAGGPYNYQSIHVIGDAVYTNNPPAGAFRGFGVTQSAMAIECLVNDLAHQVGLSGWEIRHRNAIHPGQSLPNGQIAGTDTAFVETLEAVKEEFERLEADPDCYVGIASAMKNAGIGVGLKDPGRCNLEIIDGVVHARSSAAAIGQGLTTVILQMVGEATGLGRHQIVVDAPDTSYSPNAGTTTASRQTVFTGQAARMAGEKLRADLDAGKTLAELEGNVYEGEFDFETDPISSDKPNPVSHISYGFGTQLFVLDAQGEVKEVIAAHDAGRVINPIACEGQVIGGVAMGMGYGVTEDFGYVDGVPQMKLAQIGLVKANQMPHVRSIFVNRADPTYAFGAKGIGEITCCMGAPALQNAYFKKDGVFRTKLPLEDTFYRKAKAAPAHKPERKARAAD